MSKKITFVYFNLNLNNGGKNKKGRRIKEFKETSAETAVDVLYWDKTDENNNRVKTGVYFIEVFYKDNGNSKIIRRLIVVSN